MEVNITTNLGPTSIVEVWRVSYIRNRDNLYIHRKGHIFLIDIVLTEK